tara:strand:+ start:906 stop:1106 length:201 start_codon:yes stop_codon:yes gene_type:complete
MAKKVNKLDDIKKLMADLNTTRKSLLNLRFQKATGQLEKSSQIKKLRKKIAQLCTKINQNKNLKNA